MAGPVQDQQPPRQGYHMEKQKRNRVMTTQRIIDALGVVLTEKGIEGVGINAVAQQAGVSKVLIYRYFESLQGLLDHYVRDGHVIPHFTRAALNQIRPLQRGNRGRFWSSQGLQLFREYRASRAARQVIKATVKEQNVLMDVISEAQDAELTQLISQLVLVDGGDPEATSAIVLGGLSYLTLLADMDRPLIGIDLRSEAGWQRIEGAVELICRALSQQDRKSHPEQVDLPMPNQTAAQW